MAQIAKDFGISESCVGRWVRMADTDDGVQPGPTTAESTEVRDLKRRNRVLEQEERSCDEQRPTSPRTSPQKTYPLVLGLASDGIPVAVTCRVLGFSRHAFNAWRADPVTAADYERAHLLNAARDVHRDDPEFGYRRITGELLEDGHQVSENTAHSLCRQAGIVSVIHRRRGSDKRPGSATHDDHVQPQFTAAAPNRVWLTDITEHATSEGKPYL